MKISDETIIKFRNGKELHMPPEMYEEIGTKGKGIVECSWTEGEYDFKVQFSLDDVLHITRITQNTSNKCNWFSALGCLTALKFFTFSLSSSLRK